MASRVTFCLRILRKAVKIHPEFRSFSPLTVVGVSYRARFPLSAGNDRRTGVQTSWQIIFVAGRRRGEHAFWASYRAPGVFFYFLFPHFNRADSSPLSDLYSLTG